MEILASLKYLIKTIGVDSKEEVGEEVVEVMEVVQEIRNKRVAVQIVINT
jgi:hypothetical protein